MVPPRTVSPYVLGALLACVSGSLAGCGEPPRERVAPVSPPVEAPTPSADGGLSYVVRFPEPHTHYLEVEATVPTGGEAEVELMMATWTPGSYLVREYARHVEALEAFSGEAPLEVRKTDKNRWTVHNSTGTDPVVVRYRVYAREMTVRTNFVDADMAMLNGAPTFLEPVGAHDRPRSVRVALPPGWERSVTALAPHPSGDPDHYLAADYDELVDSPILAGNPAVHSFQVHDVPHALVNLGEEGVWDGERSARDVARIVEAQVDFWGTVPYARYHFLNVLGEAGGGLEHLDSTLMLASRWDTGTRESYRGWLGLVSHELFHTWNVKRLRPEALGPFDYEEEVLTPDLWIAEGFTSYYDDLLLRRAGLISEDEYLELLSKQIASVQGTPGRLVQPLSEASWDAWIKYYRKDENSPNTQISYYRKGALVGFLLDAEIRRRTDGARSLDDVMRLAWERFSGERGYTSQAFRDVASEVAGSSLDAWFTAHVDRAAELDYGPALAWYGLRFVADGAEGEGHGSGASPAAGGERADGPAGWLGLHLDEGGGRIVVRQVRRDTPAWAAGFSVDDEILAIGDFRVPPGGWSERLKHHPPGSEAEVLVARRGKLRRIPVTFGAATEEAWTVQRDPSAGPQARQQREALLAQTVSTPTP